MKNFIEGKKEKKRKMMVVMFVQPCEYTKRHFELYTFNR